MQIPRRIVLLFVGFCSLYLLLVPGLGYNPPFTRSVSMQLTGSSTVYVSADRAIVYLRISSEGSKQSKVSDEIKETLKEVMSILRPLTEENGTSKTSAAIKDISVDELESHSWKKDTIIGQATVYSGKATVQSEFSDMESLGVVLAKLSKIPRVKVESTMWKLSEALKAKVSAESREKAMRDLLAKGYAYIKPLGLKRIRASSIDETSHHIRAVQEPGCNSGWGYNYPRSRLASRSVRQQTEYLVMHDELDIDDYQSRWSSQELEDSYEMESKSLEVVSHVSAKCEAY